MKGRILVLGIAADDDVHLKEGVKHIHFEGRQIGLSKGVDLGDLRAS